MSPLLWLLVMGSAASALAAGIAGGPLIFFGLLAIMLTLHAVGASLAYKLDDVIYVLTHPDFKPPEKDCWFGFHKWGAAFAAEPTAEEIARAKELGATQILKRRYKVCEQCGKAKKA